MLRMIGSVGFLGLIVTMAACGAHFEALQAPPLAINGSQPQRTFTVVSGIGDTFTVQKLGITVFGNAADQQSIEAWNIDPHVSGRIAKHLGSHAKVTVLAPPREAFAAFYKPESFTDGDAKLKALMQVVVGNQPADMVVVVMKSSSQLANTNQYISGLGIISLPGLFARNLMFAAFQIRVYDGRTLQPIVTRIPMTRDHKPMLTPFRAPHREIDAAWWPEPALVAKDNRLKEAIRELIDDALTRTLPDLLATR